MKLNAKEMNALSEEEIRKAFTAIVDFCVHNPVIKARCEMQFDVAALPDGNAHLRTPPSSQGALKVLKEKHVASEELIPSGPRRRLKGPP